MKAHGPYVDGLAGDRDVVGVHHAVDEADQRASEQPAPHGARSPSRRGRDSRMRPDSGGRSHGPRAAAARRRRARAAKNWKVPTTNGSTPRASARRRVAASR